MELAVNTFLLPSLSSAAGSKRKKEKEKEREREKKNMETLLTHHHKTEGEKKRK